MNEHQDYMDARMLHAFLDGELDGAHEEVLFGKLASSSDLRAEMQDQLAIRTAIQHDTDAFNPPAAATAAVFGALGFSIPSSAAAAAGLSAVQRRWITGATIVTAMVAVLLLYTQFPFAAFEKGTVTERVVSTPSTVLTIEETPALTDIPITAPFKRYSAAPPAAAPTATVENAAVMRDVDLASLGFHPVASLSSEGLATLEPARIREGQVYFYDLLPTPDGVTLYARNVALQSDPAPEVQSQRESWFRNVNLGVMYSLSEHHSIGLEAGQEAFPQTFTGLTETGTRTSSQLLTGIEGGMPVRIEQNPLAYWATAVYQFNGDALLPHVHPFLQLQVGGAFRLGGLGRASAGLKFKPVERIAIVVGIEGSMLMYRFQDNWFQTNKLGMTYGLAYEF